MRSGDRSVKEGGREGGREGGGRGKDFSVEEGGKGEGGREEGKDLYTDTIIRPLFPRVCLSLSCPSCVCICRRREI